MTKSRSIRVFAPATVANVACGFDILGFAVDAPGDDVVVHLEDQPGIKIRSITGDGGKLPTDPERNTACVPIFQMLQKLGSKQGFSIELHKHMPLGSGLGSSAASAVAAAVGANELLGRPFDRSALLPFVVEAERVACGSAHADNVAPALLGGFVLVRSIEPVDVVALAVPDELFCCVVHPHIEIRTEDARKILRNQIQLKDAITQWGNTAGLVAGLFRNDYGLIGRSMQDVVIEPKRSILIPRFNEIKAAVLAAGGLGCSISGSGPSIFALSKGEAIAKKAGKIIQQQFAEIEIESDLFVSRINRDGPRIMT